VLTGVIVLIVALALASGLGVWRKRTDGAVRIRAVDASEARAARQSADASLLTSERIGSPLGSRATLLQFSSAFCQPCRATRVILSDVAAAVDGVEHVEIDAESHLELVREIGILRTPTTLVLDGEGRITARASGIPRREQVLAALDMSVR
jgi:thiol-disulfide isomerase/thioredoxin